MRKLILLQVIYILLPFSQTNSKPNSKPYFHALANLTQEQKAAIVELRGNVESMLHLDYMKEDIYLVNFLKLMDWDAGGATGLLMSVLDWRQINNLDGILQEDFSDVETLFKVYLDGVDKKGRVVFDADTYGTWPLAYAVKEKAMAKLERFGVRLIEMATTIVRNNRKIKNSNVTEFVMLLNMNGFNMTDTGCNKCVPYYTQFTEVHELKYPFSVGQIVMVNTPKEFGSIETEIRHLMNQPTNESFIVFGSDESTWRPFVEAHFAKDQISEAFGGTKKREVEEEVTTIEPLIKPTNATRRPNFKPTTKKPPPKSPIRKPNATKPITPKPENITTTTTTTVAPTTLGSRKGNSGENVHKKKYESVSEEEEEDYEDGKSTTKKPKKKKKKKGKKIGFVGDVVEGLPRKVL